MRRFNRMSMRRGDGARPLSISGRVKIVAAVALVLLTVGVVAAYSALGSTDTATGTGALFEENGGNSNTADGFDAMFSNTTGSSNVAVGFLALHTNVTGGANTATGNSALNQNVGGTSNTAAGDHALASNTSGNNNTAAGNHAGDGDHENTTGSNNTFLGFQAAPGTDTEIDNATAVGANAVVSQSDSLVLGAPGVNVGINTTTPASRLQVGAPSTSFGEYLQVPIVNNALKTPPAGDCNNTTFRGRLVLQTNGKKTILWACTSAGVWKAI